MDQVSGPKKALICKPCAVAAASPREIHEPLVSTQTPGEQGVAVDENRMDTCKFARFLVGGSKIGPAA
jgi:hypothetical protein